MMIAAVRWFEMKRMQTNMQGDRYCDVHFLASGLSGCLTENISLEHQLMETITVERPMISPFQSL